MVQDMREIVLSIDQKKAIQKIELDMLSELDRICRKHEIKYTLAYGTLIGAVRHKGFIPWDDDVDVCMMRADYNKFREVCKTELNSKYFYQSNETDPEYYHLFDKIRANNTIFRESFLAKYNIHHGVYIDIFPIDYIPDQKIKRKIQYYKFHFYRTGLMSKYMMVNARKGKKKYAAMVLKILYMPFKLKTLYDEACRIAIKYDNHPRKEVHNFCSSYKAKDIFASSCYENITTILFENQQFLAPMAYDHILSTIYGQYRKLPPKEQQITRHSLVELQL